LWPPLPTGRLHVRPPLRRRIAAEPEKCLQAATAALFAGLHAMRPSGAPLAAAVLLLVCMPLDGEQTKSDEAGWIKASAPQSPCSLTCPAVRTASCLRPLFPSLTDTH